MNNENTVLFSSSLILLLLICFISANAPAPQEEIVEPELMEVTPYTQPTPNGENNFMVDENLADIPTDWDLTFGANPQIIFYDTTVERTTSAGSIRLDPYVSGGNIARECDGTWYDVEPGDRVVVKCWIKTGSTVYNGPNPEYEGARLGVDLCAPKGESICIVDSYPHSDAEHVASMVQWGTTTWTLREWDFIIPDTVYTHETNGTPLETPAQISQVVAWVQAVPPTFDEHAYFADAEMYINPTAEEPTYNVPVLTRQLMTLFRR